ncbi:MAG: hypothetical protein JKY01_00265 [Pseudomonadales bacterium]|nr:hypothetical protein [Pseudomonadales bacterium]
MAKTLSYGAVLAVFLLASGLLRSAGNDPTLPDYMNSGTKIKYGKIASLKSRDFNLSMIVHDGMRKSAIINNKIKSEKEYIDGARIFEIRKNSVVLIKNNERIVLNLIKGNRRK